MNLTTCPRLVISPALAPVLALLLCCSPAFSQSDSNAKRQLIENTVSSGRESATTPSPARSDKLSPVERQSEPTAARGPKVLDIRLDQRTTIERPNGWVVEWIAAEETFENWTLLASTRFYRDEPKSPREFAQNLADQIRKRRDTGDHVANAAVFASEKDDSCAIDFLVSEDGQTFEHNVMRFVRVEGGLICQQIARRAYEERPVSDQASDAPAAPRRLLWRADQEQGEPVATLIKSIPQVRARLFDDLQKLEITKSPAGR